MVCYEKLENKMVIKCNNTKGLNRIFKLHILLIYYFCNIVIIYITNFFPTRVVYVLHELIEPVR